MFVKTIIITNLIMLVCHGDTPCDGNYIQLMIIWCTSLTTGYCLSLCNLITLTWSVLASELLKSLGRLFNVEIDGKIGGRGAGGDFVMFFKIGMHHIVFM